MNKRLLTSALLLTVTGGMFAQTSAFLDQNAIHAKINSSGELFQDILKKGFEFPAGSGNSTFYSCSFIMGAQNSSGSIYAALWDDFMPGPLQDGTALPSSNAAAWDRVWKVSLDDIQYHLDHYTDAGYTPAPDIAGWPAHGQSVYGEPANIAPFVDANGNGTYEPMAGDYPRIKGTQAVFFVYNDQAPGPTPGLSMGIEVQCMAYVFNCSGNAALDNTVFVNYRVIYKNTLTLHEAYMGLLADTDLGYFMDDYAGFDVSEGMAYAYNGDNYDEPNTGSPGYNNNLPVQGIALLGGPWQDADATDNPVINDYDAAAAANGIVYPALGMGYGDGITDNERLGIKHFISYTGIGALNAGMSDPDNGEQAYNYLRGMWRDGTPLVYGGAGYPGLPGSTDTLSDYIFFGDSDPFHAATHGTSVPGNWTELLAGNIPGDRRGICSTGPFTLAPGEVNELDLAFTAAIDVTGSGAPLAALPDLNARVNAVRTYFNNNLTPCGSFYNGINEKTAAASISVYPNPVSQLLNITMTGNDPTWYVIYNAQGKTVLEGRLFNGSGQADVSTLPDGIYTIQTGKTAAQPLMIIH